MSQQARGDVGVMLSVLGRAWGWALAFGLVSILAGLAVIFWPDRALAVIAVLFGLYLVLSGIFRLVAAFAVPADRGWFRVLMVILGVLSLVVGVYLLRHPGFSLLVLALTLGLFWMAHGVVELFGAIGHEELPGRGWAVASGILGIVAGAVVFFYPEISLTVLTIVLGIWLLIYGAMLTVGAIGLRAAARELGAGSEPASPAGAGPTGPGPGR
jgi:uncharacterized membrane protein HdeD (DUF308 family)